MRNFWKKIGQLRWEVILVASVIAVILSILILTSL